MEVLYITPKTPYKKGDEEQKKSYNQIYNFVTEGVKVDCIFLNDNFYYLSPSSNIIEQSFNSSDIEIKKMNKSYKLMLQYLVKDIPFQIMKNYSEELKGIIEKCLESKDYNVVHIHYSLMFNLHDIDWGNAKVIVDYFDPLSLKIKRKYEDTINTITRLFLREELQRLIKYERMIMGKFENGIVYTITDKNELSDRTNSNNLKMIPNVLQEDDEKRNKQENYPIKNLLYLYSIFLNDQRTRVENE
ncbi:hypothetical protein ACERII_10915 [Evansella sp. AB-rgal1]|uniref:hypothetical protein n=1 Tax=Evansella sp. AB-rgal1 TaxID=3242696 RepID=UPI00359D9977